MLQISENLSYLDKIVLNEKSKIGLKFWVKNLELLAMKLAIQTFSKTLKQKAIHLPVDNMVALTYLLRMGGTQNLRLVQLAKEIWDHLLQCGIILTVEYPPGNRT